MKNLHEVFTEFEKAESRNDKIAVLRFNRSYALRYVLQGIFDPRIKFTVTEIPEFKPLITPIGMGWSTISQELGRVYLFQEGNPRTPPALTEKRKKEILIQILEALEPKEADIFANMLLKKTKVKGLTEKIVKEAFPDLIGGGVRD